MKKYLFVLFIFVLNVDCNNPFDGLSVTEEFVETIKYELESFMSSPDPDINDLPENLALIASMVKIILQDKDAFSSSERLFFGDRAFYCGPCNFVADIAIGYFRIGGPFDLAAAFISKLCFAFLYHDYGVCYGVMHEQKDLEYIARNSDITGEMFCTLALEPYGCGPYAGPAWEVEISSSETPNNIFEELLQFFGGFFSFLFPSGSNDTSTNADAVPQLITPTIKILHITDPHYDPDYAVGSNALCEAPLCCNNDSGWVIFPHQAAGKWGDYRNCDTPKWLLENMFTHIKAEHPDLTFIYSTGDQIPHTLWKITREGNEETIAEFDNLLEKYFSDIPIYGAIGNHDSAPSNIFSPPEATELDGTEYSKAWLYNAVVDGWEKLSNQTLPSTARYAGYYSILIEEGFRLISINSIFGYHLNWWVLYKSTDMANQLQWLENELNAAESNGEKVHIIGHLAPLYMDTYGEWTHQYNRIITRYASIIKNQVFGHVHTDEQRIHYDVNNPTNPVGVEYLAPNTGPWTDYNPAYRIYIVDGTHAATTRDVLDVQTYIMNLTHANLHDEPIWYKLYSAKEDLGMVDMSPSSWDDLVKRMATDDTLFNKYFRYFVQDGDTSISKGCDSNCKKTIICDIVDNDDYLPKICPLL